MVSDAPPRTCVGCRRVRPKDELVRLARTLTSVHEDPDQRLPGRGAYICPDTRCVDAAARRGAVPRALRGGRPDQACAVLDELRTRLDDDSTMRSENA